MKELLRNNPKLKAELEKKVREYYSIASQESKSSKNTSTGK